MNVGIIGTGALGLPMAERLQRSIPPLYFYARRPDVISHLGQLGARFCEKSELGKNCGVVLFVLNSYDQCLECVREVLPNMEPGSLLVIHSTIGPNEMRFLEETVKKHQIGLVAAPVTGGVAGARDGSLTIMTGGKRRDIEKIEGVFSILGSHILYMGEDTGAASAMKLLVQMLVGIHTAAAAEALCLGIRSGLNPELIYQTICLSSGVSQIFRSRARSMIDHDYATRGTVEILNKDLHYCESLSETLDCTLPVMEACCGLFRDAVRTLKDTSEDFSAVARLYHL